MDFIFSVIIVFILIGFVYLLVKPKKVPKTTAQKQEEILQGYKDMMDKELARYLNDEKLLLQKKTALLKVIADELNRNIFFDVPQTRELISKLVSYSLKI